MLSRLRLSKFRSHEDTALDLGPVNLLIGPVASGKSNIFQGLVLIQNSVHRSLVELFPPGLGEFHWVRSRWASETDPISFEVDLRDLPGFPEVTARYALKIAAGPEGLYVLEEALSRRAGDEPSQWVFQRHMRRPRVGEFGEIGPYDPTILNLVWHHDPRIALRDAGPRFAREVARALSSFGYFHLEVSALKALGAGQPADRILYRGHRLPDFIASLKFDESQADIYERIRAEMREVLPDLDAIIVTQASSDRQGIAMSFRAQRGYIAAPDLSDGTLFSLGLLCVIHGPQRPAVLCIEEPETGLHPGRLRWLSERLIALAYAQDAERPCQIIISTHSPYLVDYFRDLREHVHVFERREGHTRARRLTDIQTQLHDETDEADAIGHQWAMGLYEGL